MFWITTCGKAGYKWHGHFHSFEEAAERLYGCFTGWKLINVNDLYAKIVKDTDENYVVATMQITI